MYVHILLSLGTILTDMQILEEGKAFELGRSFHVPFAVSDLSSTRETGQSEGHSC